MKKTNMTYYNKHTGNYCRYSIEIPASNLVILKDADMEGSTTLTNTLCANFIDDLIEMFNINPTSTFIAIDTDNLARIYK